MAQQVELSPASIEALAELLTPKLKPQPAASVLDVVYLSVTDAAKRQSVSAKTLHRMIDRGELHAYKFGRSIRVKVADLDRAAKRIKTVSETFGDADE